MKNMVYQLFQSCSFANNKNKYIHMYLAVLIANTWAFIHIYLTIYEANFHMWIYTHKHTYQSKNIHPIACQFVKLLPVGNKEQVSAKPKLVSRSPQAIQLVQHHLVTTHATCIIKKNPQQLLKRIHPIIIINVLQVLIQ